MGYDFEILDVHSDVIMNLLSCILKASMMLMHFSGERMTK